MALRNLHCALKIIVAHCLTKLHRCARLNWKTTTMKYLYTFLLAMLALPLMACTEYPSYYDSDTYPDYYYPYYYGYPGYYYPGYYSRYYFYRNHFDRDDFGRAHGFGHGGHIGGFHRHR